MKKRIIKKYNNVIISLEYDDYDEIRLKVKCRYGELLEHTCNFINENSEYCKNCAIKINNLWKNGFIEIFENIENLKKEKILKIKKDKKDRRQIKRIRINKYIKKEKRILNEDDFKNIGKISLTGINQFNSTGFCLFCKLPIISGKIYCNQDCRNKMKAYRKKIRKDELKKSINVLKINKIKINKNLLNKLENNIIDEPNKGYKKAVKSTNVLEKILKNIDESKNIKNELINLTPENKDELKKYFEEKFEGYAATCDCDNQNEIITPKAMTDIGKQIENLYYKKYNYHKEKLNKIENNKNKIKSNNKKVRLTNINDSSDIIEYISASEGSRQLSKDRSYLRNLIKKGYLVTINGKKYKAEYIN
jgi:hypothetical protein